MQSKKNNSPQHLRYEDGNPYQWVQTNSRMLNKSNSRPKKPNSS